MFITYETCQCVHFVVVIFYYKLLAKLAVKLNEIPVVGQ